MKRAFPDPLTTKPGPYGTGRRFATLPASDLNRQVNATSSQPGGDNRRRIQHTPYAPVRPVSLVRRLGAAFYDAIAVLGLWFGATALVLGAVTRGAAVPPGNPYFMLYLTVVAMIYFVWSWRAAGQTLGMRAWGIRVAAPGGQTPRTAVLAARFLVALVSWACLGMGFLWALTRRDRRTWHDLATGTWLVRDQAKVRRK